LNIHIMREIKFRIWDYENSEGARMQYCDEIEVYDNGLFFEISKFNLAENHNDTKKPVIMQFTGLSDSYAREIYEGDILKLNIGREEVVEFENGSFFCRYRHRPLGELLLSDDFENIEIIGNIYENPD